MLQYNMSDSSSQRRFWQFYKLQCSPYCYTKEKIKLIGSDFLFCYKSLLNLLTSL